MTGTKISDLPSASTLTGAELVPVVQSDVTKKTTITDILTSAGAGTVTSVNVSGGTTGLTATGGPITTSGTITLAGTLDVDNGGTGATTASGARSNLGAAASGANSDITSMTGVTGGISTPDFIQFDTAAGATTAVAKEYWDDSSGGLSYGMKGGNVTQNTGQQTYQRVYNATGATIAKGSVVYVTGSSGTRITVAKAQATADATSATVLGVTAEAIANNSEGFVLTQGEITNISTTGISDGALLWLSPSVAGAFTSTKPTAPDHLVLVGYCIKGGSGGAGIIYVKMENGYELGELHDVYVSSPANGQTLIYNETNDRWENHNLTAGSGITITNGAGSVSIAATNSGTVTSVNASGGTTGMSFSGGPVTSSGTLTLAGTLAVANGGTGATTASNARTNLGLVIGTDVPSVSGSGATGTWSISVNGNAATVTNGVYTSGSYADPTWLTSLASSKLTGQVAIANGGTAASTASGARTNLLPSYTSNSGKVLAVNTGATDVEWISVGGTGTVTSVAVSGGSTGLTTSGGPITGSGTITLAGTLAVGYGGTGATTASNARTNLLPSYSTNAGKVLAVNTGATDVEWISVGGTGTVTSVDVSGGTTGLSFSGGPVTSSGTITAGGTLGVANGGTGATTLTGYVKGSGTSAFTASSTIPGSDVSGNISGNAANVTGTVAVANGGTGQTTYTDGQLLIGNTSTSSLTKATLTAGSGVSITNGNGSISISATGSGGTVTSVGGTGTVNGITLTGTVTSTGNLTLGGTLSGVNLATQVSGTLPVANGGTGLTAGTSGGVLYYSATGTLASSNALAANNLVIGGGAGTAPSTITTGTGVVTALGINTGSAGAFVVNGGALGTPSSGTLTNATGLPVSSGISGFGTGVATALAVNTGTAGAFVVNGGALGTPSSGTLTNATGLPLSTGVTGTLPVGNGGTGATTLTGVLKGNGTSAFTAATAGTDYVAPGTATTFTASQTFNGSSSVTAAIFANAAETTTISATAATGTINYDITTQSVIYYTSNASANWTVNFRGSSGTSLNTLMSTGQSITVAFLVTQGATAYYNSAVQVDGASVTPKYQGGTAWTAGNASGIDAYVYTIVKTGSAAFTVFASQTQFK